MKDFFPLSSYGIESYISQAELGWLIGLPSDTEAQEIGKTLDTEEKRHSTKGQSLTDFYRKRNLRTVRQVDGAENRTPQNQAQISGDKARS